jgi:hypothetical protein
MPCVVFEPTIPASERAKTVHALDRSANRDRPNFLIGKHKGDHFVGKDNIKVNFKQVMCKDLYWIRHSQDSVW